MQNIIPDQDDYIFTINISRGKVNAINDQLVSELSMYLHKLADDSHCKTVIITGRGNFFSFGFDIPELLKYSKNEFLDYLSKFNDLVKQIFMFPKPVIASINGHCIAGGCIIALASDFRIMSNSGAKISINEINFGSTLFSTAVEILKHVVGSRRAETILFSGKMYLADDALNAGLVDEVYPEEELKRRVLEIASQYSEKDPSSFQSLKRISRLKTMESISSMEKESLIEFTEIWYSEQTRENLEKIIIRE